MNRRKLFAFFGIVPLGAFVFVHVITTSTAMSGAARFDRVFARTPVLTSFTMLVVMAPLLTHAAWGLLVARQPRALNLPGWMPRLRRWSAVVLLVFLIAHVAELPLRGWLGEISSDAMFDVMTSHMSSTWHSFPLVALGYLVGTAATLFHLGTALWASFRASGILVADRTNALFKWGILVVSAVLLVLAGATIVYLATGTRLLYPAPAFTPDGPPSTCSPKT